VPTRSSCPSSSDRRMLPAIVACSLLTLLALFVPVAGAAGVTPQEPAAEPLPATDPVCEPSPEIADLLSQLQEVAAECGLSTGCARRQEALLKSALEQHPGDFHLTRAAQDLWQSFSPLAEADPAGRDERVAEYRRNAEEHPESAEALYLYGRFVADPEQALGIFKQAVTADPGFPWPHLGIAAMKARLASGGAGMDDADKQAFRQEIGAFLDRCPGRLPAGAGLLSYVSDKDFWRTRAERGRAVLEAMGPERALGRYPALWRMLYAGTPLASHGEVDPLVRADLQRIEALGLEQRKAWWKALDSGYEMLGDEANQERIRNARLEHDPCGTASVFARAQKWGEEHPSPAPDAPEEERTAHARLTWDTAGAWIETCPDAAYFWHLRLLAAQQLDDLPADEVLHTADRLLELADSAPYKSGTPTELEVAQVYVEHGLRLEQVHDLAERGLAKALEENDRMLESGGLPERMQEVVTKEQLFLRWQALQIETKAALALEDPAEARELLLDLRNLADEARPGDDPSALDTSLFQTFDGGYWSFRAELADLEGKPLDAAVFRARAVALSPDADAATEKKREARDAWIESGGSEESWQALLEGFYAEGGPRADRQATLWDEQEVPLPEFELADLSGGTWHRKDLEGKTVFANVWATWCGPCRKELPLVEELKKRLAGRDDVAVVTLNIDTNPALALHFMEKKGYTFPVLQAGELVNQLGKQGAVPRSWILDPAAVLRREQIGFADRQDWVDSVIEMLGKVADGDGSSGG